jgi:hypothetical protein
MMIRTYIRLVSLRKLLFARVIGWLALKATSGQAQMTLNVTNFGARRDAVQFSAITIRNSTLIISQSTN